MQPSPPSTPTVSVIIATYRGGEFLRQAIVSVLDQSFGDFELLVADDGNDAQTREIAESFRDSRVIYFGNQQKLGPAENHWAAMRRSYGRYLSILNHDDMWRPGFLLRMLECFRDKQVVVAFSDHDIIDQHGTVLSERAKQLSMQTGRDVLEAGLHRPFYQLAVWCSIPTAQSALFLRSSLDLEALPAVAGPAYDFWLNYLLARTGGAAFYVAERLASWRVHETAISRDATRSDWPVGSGACWERIAADDVFAAFKPIAKRRAADCFASAALACLRGGRRKEALDHAQDSVKNSFRSSRALMIFLLCLLPGFMQNSLLRKG